MHVVTVPTSQDAVIKLDNYNSPIYVHMRVVTAPVSQDAVIKFKNYNSPIYTCMRVDTGPALQGAVIKFESYNSPIYTCVLSLCPLRWMQLSNSRIITLRYTHILYSTTVRLYVQSGQPVHRLRSKNAILLFGKVRDENSLFSLLPPPPPTLCTPPPPVSSRSPR